MPFTPFHVGPAVAIKAIIPRYFSLTVFVISQILIDLEPLYFIITDDPPLHRFFHTFLGAGTIFILVLLIGKPLGQLWLKLWNRTIAPGSYSRLYCNDNITFKAGAIAAFIGVLSHVLLDSIMHADVLPFSPWSDHNAMLGIIDLLALHFSLIAIGTVGAFWLLLMALMNRFK